MKKKLCLPALGICSALAVWSFTGCGDQTAESQGGDSPNPAWAVPGTEILIVADRLNQDVPNKAAWEALQKKTQALVETSGITIPEVLPHNVELSEKEISLIQTLTDFKTVVKQAGNDYNPSCIANYCYDLVKEYNQFYHDFSILREEDENKKLVRLALSANVGKVVRTGMGLLGIEVPERM